MRVHVVLKFFNQVYLPAFELLNMLAEHPLALEPESNRLIHQFEGLVLHVNHFAEKNHIKDFNANKNFRDLANSIKHPRDGQPNKVTIFSSAIYETSNLEFRFIRNTIIAAYPDGSEFDAIENMCSVVNQYLLLLDKHRERLIASESKYAFYNWAFAYLKYNMSGVTKHSRIITVKKIGCDYVRCDVDVKYIMLDEGCIGKDPGQFFPNLLVC